jgi:hypothetical protein
MIPNMFISLSSSEDTEDGCCPLILVWMSWKHEENEENKENNRQKRVKVPCNAIITVLYVDERKLK